MPTRSATYGILTGYQPAKDPGTPAPLVTWSPGRPLTWSPHNVGVILRAYSAYLLTADGLQRDEGCVHGGVPSEGGVAVHDLRRAALSRHHGSALPEEGPITAATTTTTASTTTASTTAAATATCTATNGPGPSHAAMETPEGRAELSRERLTHLIGVTGQGSGVRGQWSGVMGQGLRDRGSGWVGVRVRVRVRVGVQENGWGHG